MPTATDFLLQAAAEVGTAEDPPGSNRTKYAAEAHHANGWPWCATFLVAIANRVKLTLPSVSAYTPTMANGFKAAGRFVSTPEAGDFVFYDFPDASNRIQHVGVVAQVRADGKLETIEGNTSYANDTNGGCVMRRVRSQASVVGFGRPSWSPAPAPLPPKPPAVGSPQLLEESIMAVFKDDGDREVWFVRHAYLTLLRREPDDADTVYRWVEQLRAQGGDFVWSQIADSDEGQFVRAQERRHLGLD